MKNKLLVSFSILLVLGFLFYWYEFRPSKIRSFCNWSIRWGPDKPSGSLTGERYDYLYKMCLRSKGIEK